MNDYEVLVREAAPTDIADVESLEKDLGVHPANSVLPRLVRPQRDRDTEAACFGAWRGGRLASWLRVCRDDRAIAHLGSAVAFLTEFMSRDDPQSAIGVFEAACTWARGHRLDRIRGPMSARISDRRGSLLSQGANAPALGLSRNPAYEEHLFDAAGFVKAADLFAYRIRMEHNPRISRAADFVKRRRPGLSVRRVDLSRIEAEIESIISIYNEAWSDHWSFIPLVKAQLLGAFEELKDIVFPEWIFFLTLNGADIGVFVAVPNILDERRNARGLPMSARGMLFGVRRAYHGRGLDVVLLEEAVAVMRRFGVEEGEIGWILESNRQWTDEIENAFNGSLIDRHRFRIYEKSTNFV